MSVSAIMPPEWQPPSITGDPLSGRKHVRFAYIDEAGISNKAHEPFLVMAGIIIHPDSQYREIRCDLRALADRYFPDIDHAFGKQFNFHAKDIWHGSGFYPREQWPREKRMKLLAEILTIITDHELPVVYGIVNRRQHEQKINQQRTITQKQVLIDAASLAYFRCVKRIEEWMCEEAWDEVVSLVMENNNELKGVIKDFHYLVTNHVDQPGRMDRVPDYFESNHIVEAINFVEKDQSPIIQLADICSFVAKRKLQNCPDVKPLFDQMKGNLSHHSADGIGLALGRRKDVMILADRLKDD